MTVAARPPDGAFEVEWDGHTFDEVITLNGGPSVRLGVWRRVLDFEARGIKLRSDERGRLVANPREALTGADVAWLREHLHDAKAVVAYRAPEL